RGSGEWCPSIRSRPMRTQYRARRDDLGCRATRVASRLWDSSAGGTAFGETEPRRGRLRASGGGARAAASWKLHGAWTSPFVKFERGHPDRVERRRSKCAARQLPELFPQLPGGGVQRRRRGGGALEELPHLFGNGGEGCAGGEVAAQKVSDSLCSPLQVQTNTGG